jgi:RNA polymerase sigma-70 factor, ECF subfamily
MPGVRRARQDSSVQVSAENDRIRELPGETADEALIRATVEGDRDAFAVLVRRYLRKAMAVALEYADAREDAEDVVQDTFRIVYQNIGRFEAGRRFEPWFFTILRNTARNAVKHRRVRRHEALDAEHVTTAATPEDSTRRSELRRRISHAMDRLPSMQRTCFRLCVVEGFTSAEAAMAIGLAESTVRVHVFKARHSMQRWLEAWRNEVEG